MPAASSALVKLPDNSADAPDLAAPEQLVQRLRLVIISTAIALLVLSQNSGSVAADTKLDLVVDPARFLGRALNLWDPTGNSGQLQDQAYGYLFPMGPFFLVGHWLALPAWLIQRGWEAGLLIVAFLGMYRLARLLGGQGFWSAAASGLAYALSPRMLTELFSISAELLPVAVLPLVLIPLVKGIRFGSPRNAALLSGVGILFAGGINASATLAILPVPAIWLLTRTRGPRRRALIRWWLLAVVLSTLWWVIPLLALGKFSPPFLDWIESASVTTSQNSFVAIARGADHWQSYLGPNIWPAGWIYAVGVAAILATAAVAAIGLAGLVVRGNPERVFLTFTTLIGFVLLSLGHSAAIEGIAPHDIRQLLDGPLVAFRNIHKFDPLVRLPLALGVGFAITALGRALEKYLNRTLPEAQRRTGQLIATAALLAVGAVALSPVWGNHLVQQPRSEAVASFWPQASNWLEQHEGDGRALVLPGAGRPEMYWGSTIDEPMQATAKSAWATREIVPFGQPGYVRLLDSVESMVGSGVPQPELAPLLSRMGIRFIVLRADLTPTADATDIGVAWSTLHDSAGFTTAAQFGPDLRLTGATNRLIDRGIANDIPAIEVLQVQGWQGPVSLLPLDNAVVANGSSDELPLLLSNGVASSSPVFFGGDADKLNLTSAQRVITDGTRKREVQFGHPGYVGATMTANQSYQSDRPEHDYVPTSGDPLSVYQYEGISDIRASSSGADAAAYVNRGPQHAAWYAVDGDPATAWESGSADGAVGQWLELDLRDPVSVSAITMQFAPDLADFPTEVRVSTESGVRIDEVTPDARPQALALPAGPAQAIRVQITRMASGSRGVAVGISTLAVPGVFPQRFLSVPSGSEATEIEFQAATGARTGCVSAGTASACLPRVAQRGEESQGVNRAFDLSSSGDFVASGSAQLMPGTAADRLLDSALPASVTASSTLDDDPRHRPGAVLDGLIGSTWQPRPDDLQPTLTLTMAKDSLVRGVQVALDKDAPAARATRVRVTAAGDSWTLEPDADGVIRFPESVTTRSISLQVLSTSLRVSTDSVSGNTEFLPVGISELKVLGSPLAAAKEEVRLSCGEGPALNINGTSFSTAVDIPIAKALAGGLLSVRICTQRPISLNAGANSLTFGSTAVVTASSVRLVVAGADVALAPAEPTPRIQDWSADSRRVHVTSATRSVLVVHENFNKGWHATLANVSLQPIQVDGWEQGFVVPSGADGVVHLDYRPNGTFHVGLGLGLLAALALVILAFFWRGPHDFPALEARLLPRAVGVGIALVLLVAMATWAGLALGLVLLGTGWWWRKFLVRKSIRTLLPGAVAAALGLAGLLNAIGPSVSSNALTDSWLCQGLVVLALALAVSVAVLDNS